MEVATMKNKMIFARQGQDSCPIELAVQFASGFPAMLATVEGTPGQFSSGSSQIRALLASVDRKNAYDFRQP